jgi:hypothetical protein
MICILPQVTKDLLAVKYYFHFIIAPRRGAFFESKEKWINLPALLMGILNIFRNSAINQ